MIDHLAPDLMTSDLLTADGLTVASALLGDLVVAADELLELPAGLYGFEACQRFALVPAGRDDLWWLQSVDRPELVFLVADPFAFFPGYAIDVPDADLAALDLAAAASPLVLVIATLPAAPAGAPTANLRAPLLVSPERRLARQVVLTDETRSMAAPLAI